MRNKNSRFIFMVFLMLLSMVSLFSCQEKKATIAHIDYSFSGCFASGNAKMVITKQGESIFARCEESGQPSRMAKLNPLQMESFDIFMKELNAIKPGGLCTTQANYLVYYKNKKIEITDGTCDWNGFEKLTNIFFMEGEKF